MIHPRLSINAACSYNWSFDEDLALWQELGVHHAGLNLYKLADDRAAKCARLKAAGIRPSTIVCGPMELTAPETWEATRTLMNGALDLAAEMGEGSVYFLSGRTTGKPWREVLEVFAEAVAPSVAHARSRGITLGIEPSHRGDVSFVNTLRDAVDVAERTGVALVADFGSCWLERDLREVLRRARPHICLVQICDVVISRASAPRVHVGEGELPLRRLMLEVLDAGYEGLFDLEVIGPSIEAEGYAPALRRGAERASALLAEMGI